AGLVVLWSRGGARKSWPARLGAAGALTFLASLGGVLFFAFCQLRYGHWDMYMINQRLGWGIEPDYLALFKPDIYRGPVPAFVGGLVNPNFLSVAAVPAAVRLVLLLFW